MSDTKTVKVDGPDLAFAKMDDDTLEISDPDDQTIVYYLSQEDAYEVGLWMAAKFAPKKGIN